MTPQQIKERIKAIADEKIALNEQLRTLRLQAEKTLLREYYLYDCVYGSDTFNKLRCLRITLKQTDASVAEFATHAELYGTAPVVSDYHHSVGYIQQDGYLCHIGGGSLLLNESTPLADGEWKLLCAGDFNTIRNRMWVNWGITLVESNR